jgi:hypothetical protein
MYLKNQSSSTNTKNFILSNQMLDENNRWIVMANLIPWQELEEEYANIFSEKLGAPAKPFRMALGALIIQQKSRITDRETVEQIQ